MANIRNYSATILPHVLILAQLDTVAVGAADAIVDLDYK